LGRLKFQLEAEDGQARAARFWLGPKQIQTPLFMPVGTAATVKAMTSEELTQIGFPLILGNTYHLFLRPGDSLIKELGGLHKFMNWPGAILTDSGGFQVFSLAKLTKITEAGVTFQSHLDGTKLAFTPESVIQTQENLGSDIMMVLDECLPIPSEREQVKESIALTHRWAERSLKARRSENAMFGIVQGADFEELRRESALGLVDLGFDGYAIGGLSVGESKSIMAEVCGYTTPLLPKDKPRYLMGVGDPVDLLNGIEAGIDLFDCVLPTRNARNGGLFTSLGKINIKHSSHRTNPGPLDPNCGCSVCQNYSRAYLRHLFQSGEILASRLNTYHNLHFLHDLMNQARQAILANRFAQFKRDWLARYLGD